MELSAVDVRNQLVAEKALSGMAGEFGFSQIPPIEGVFDGEVFAWNFARSQSSLPTCVLCFGVFRLHTCALIVDLLGSQLPVRSLREYGLEGNVIQYNLHQFQRYQMKKRPDQILPVRIPLPSSWDERMEEFTRMRVELTDVNAVVWDRIARRL